jgi:uncharacterized membrane protein YadS
MTFARRTVSVVGWIGVTLSLVAAVVAATFVYMDEATDAAAAADMLKTGVTVQATPTYASSSTTTRRRGGSTTTYTIRYSFWHAQKRLVLGEDKATQSEFKALTDPDHPSTIRRGAMVDVVYDPANPAKNGLKSRFETQRSIDYFTVGLALVIAFGAGLLVVWPVHAFMKKRIAAGSMTTGMAALQAPPAG